MKRYIYFLLLMICISTNAQTNVGSMVPEVDSTFLSKLTGEFFFENKQYVGEQFFNNDWANGDILLSTGVMIYNKSLKYNGLFDELIWLNTFNFGKFKLDKSFIDEFWLKNILGADIHFKQINVSDTSNVKQRCVFAEVKVEGKLSLYIQRKISVVGSENVSKNGIIYSFDDIEATPRYCIKLPSNHYLMLTKLRRGVFLKLFPEQKKTITKIIRDNHLNIKNEVEFVKLIELMNNEVVL